MCSISFEAIQVSEMGLLLLGLYLGPFLYTGTTSAVFQLLDAVPVDKELL